MTTSTTLPIDAVKALQQASLVKDTPEDPMARRKAIDSTIDRIKTKYPQFFKEQDHEIN